MTSVHRISREIVDTLGEGPIWSARRNSLLWVDIMGQRIQMLDIDNGRADCWAVPEPVGWIVERQGSPALLAGFKSGIVSLILDPLAIEPVMSPEPDRPENRLNDAKVDAAGRLWFGSKDDRDQEESGALYRLDRDGRCTRMDDGYKVTNGPAFSPDGRILYHTDSGRRTIYRFPLGPDGELGKRAAFLTFEDGWGYPDGMTVDAEGHLWVAHWAGGRISRFDPVGRLVVSVPIPAANVTSCTFAGPDLDRMFVTTAALDSPQSPDDGALFEFDPGVRGVPQMPFAGK